MNTVSVTQEVAANGSTPDFDLGTWIGRREAFSVMAGKARAAEVECIRKIRDEKLYLAKSPDWATFCQCFLGASKSHVNSEIRYLEIFGPQYFELGRITHVPPDVFRAIKENVTLQGVNLDGELIPLSTENSQRLSAAVAELRRRAEEETRQALPAAEDDDVFREIEKKFKRLIADVRTLPPFPSYDNRSFTLSRLLDGLRKAAKDRGAPVDL